MASFCIYKLHTAEQLDLFYSEDGKLSLERVKEVMTSRKSIINSNGEIAGEGFINPLIRQINEVEVLNVTATTMVTLGNYFWTTIDEDQALNTEEKQFSYYSKANIILTKDSYLIISFANSTEEKTKGKVKSLIEEIGFECNIVQIDDDLLRKIQEIETYSWCGAKIDRIDKDGDKTTKVSYEIDSADIVNTSQVDEQYRNHGVLTYLKFLYPYNTGMPNDKVNVKLYNNGHKVVYEVHELRGTDTLSFIILLSEEIIQLKG